MLGRLYCRLHMLSPDPFGFQVKIFLLFEENNLVAVIFDDCLIRAADRSHSRIVITIVPKIEPTVMDSTNGLICPFVNQGQFTVAPGSINGVLNFGVPASAACWSYLLGINNLNFIGTCIGRITIF